MDHEVNNYRVRQTGAGGWSWSGVREKHCSAGWNWRLELEKYEKEIMYGCSAGHQPNTVNCRFDRRPSRHTAPGMPTAVIASPATLRIHR
jgi:hypothetical protein